MTLPEIPGTSEGTFTGVLELPWPWPPHTIVRPLSRKLRDGNISLSIESTGRMRVRLSRTDDGALEVLSCPLRQPERTATTICIIWKGEHLDLRINDVLVASSSEETPEQYAFPPPNLAAPMTDFSKESDTARKKRRGLVTGTNPRRGRERGNNAYIFGGLSDALIQMKDMLAHIERGEIAFAGGLSSQVRTLIGDKKGGLLQWCAGVLDESLIIYTAANPRLPPPKDIPDPRDRIRLTASAVPTLLTKNPVDLDVWLTFPAAQLGSEILSNRDVIHRVGSTIGSHFDVDKHPLVGALRSYELPGDIDMLVCLMRRVARVVIGLGDLLLSKKPSE